MQQIKIQLADTNSNKIRFIEELCVDLGLEFGNSNSKTQIQIKSDWGEHYKPTKKEAEFKIKNLELIIKEIQAFTNG